MTMKEKTMMTKNEGEDYDDQEGGFDDHVQRCTFYQLPVGVKFVVGAAKIKFTENNGQVVFC